MSSMPTTQLTWHFRWRNTLKKQVLFLLWDPQTLRSMSKGVFLSIFNTNIIWSYANNAFASKQVLFGLWSWFFHHWDQNSNLSRTPLFLLAWVICNSVRLLFHWILLLFFVLFFFFFFFTSIEVIHNVQFDPDYWPENFLCPASEEACRWYNFRFIWFSLHPPCWIPWFSLSNACVARQIISSLTDCHPGKKQGSICECLWKRGKSALFIFLNSNLVKIQIDYLI